MLIYLRKFFLRNHLKYTLLYLNLPNGNDFASGQAADNRQLAFSLHASFTRAWLHNIINSYRSVRRRNHWICRLIPVQSSKATARRHSLHGYWRKHGSPAICTVRVADIRILHILKTTVPLPAFSVLPAAMDILACLNRVAAQKFTLEDIYRYERELQAKHPQNHHIRPKIRQQLQFLRDLGYITFMCHGKYQIIR